MLSDPGSMSLNYRDMRAQFNITIRSTFLKKRCVQRFFKKRLEGYRMQVPDRVCCRESVAVRLRSVKRSNPTLTRPRPYSCSGSRFRGSNFRAKTTASAEPEPATAEASTTRIVASTILARRSTRSFSVTMGGNRTVRLRSL